jgi:hypothetical protein
VSPTAEPHLENKWRIHGVIPPLPTQIHYKDKPGTQRESNGISRNYRQNKRLNNPTFSANTINHKCLQPSVDIRPYVMRRWTCPHTRHTKMTVEEWRNTPLMNLVSRWGWKVNRTVRLFWSPSPIKSKVVWQFPDCGLPERNNRRQTSLSGRNAFGQSAQMTCSGLDISISTDLLYFVQSLHITAHHEQWTLYIPSYSLGSTFLSMYIWFYSCLIM